jgi:hypothetical protein
MTNHGGTLSQTTSATFCGRRDGEDPAGLGRASSSGTCGLTRWTMSSAKDVALKALAAHQHPSTSDTKLAEPQLFAAPCSSSPALSILPDCNGIKGRDDMKKRGVSRKILTVALALGLLANAGRKPAFAKDRDVIGSARATAIGANPTTPVAGAARADECPRLG